MVYWNRNIQILIRSPSLYTAISGITNNDEATTSDYRCNPVCIMNHEERWDPGEEEIVMDEIKEVGELLHMKWTKLLAKGLEDEKKFPSTWKNSKMVLIHKKRDSRIALVRTHTSIRQAE